MSSLEELRIELQELKGEVDEKEKEHKDAIEHKDDEHKQAMDEKEKEHKDAIEHKDDEHKQAMDDEHKKHEANYQSMIAVLKAEEEKEKDKEKKEAMRKARRAMEEEHKKHEADRDLPDKFKHHGKHGYKSEHSENIGLAKKLLAYEPTKGQEPIQEAETTKFANQYQLGYSQTQGYPEDLLY